MKKQLLGGLVVMAAICSLSIISCSKSGGYGNNNYNPPPPGGTNTTVTTLGMYFSPSSLSVKVGTTVTFNNNDNMTHTITADDNSFDSGNLAAGYSFTRKFTTVGSFSYHCNIHPNMKGTINVTQ